MIWMYFRRWLSYTSGRKCLLIYGHTCMCWTYALRWLCCNAYFLMRAFAQTQGERKRGRKQHRALPFPGHTHTHLERILAVSFHIIFVSDLRLCASIAFIYSQTSAVWQRCEGQVTLGLMVMCPIMASYLLYLLTNGWVAYGSAFLIVLVGAAWFVRVHILISRTYAALLTWTVTMACVNVSSVYV